MTRLTAWVAGVMWCAFCWCVSSVDGEPAGGPPPVGTAGRLFGIHKSFVNYLVRPNIALNDSAGLLAPR